MRPHYRPPRNKQYFHTKPKMDKRDMAALKKKVEVVYQKKRKIKYKEQYF